MHLLAEEAMTTICAADKFSFAPAVSNRVAFFHQGAIEEIDKQANNFGSPRSEHLRKSLSDIC